MLLRNESKVYHSVHIKLVFDDASAKELDIYKTDYVRVDYRKNGCKESVTGAIVDIIPYIKSKCTCDDRRESALIKVDASKDFNSDIAVFDIGDIIDITKLTPVHCCCCQCGNKNDNSSDDKGDEVNGQEEA